jgi:hypothetical protein
MGGKHKKCKFSEGCLLIASFGFRDGKGTQFCSKHKSNGMLNLLCKLCDCGLSRPTYNYPGLTANFCKECKEDGMINVNDKLCKCGKSRPTFNFKGFPAEYCSKCKTNEMINVKDTYCKCGKSQHPNFNFTGLTPEYCGKCMTEGMIDVKHSKCKCGKVQPSFNYEGLSPEYCKSCKKDGMLMIRKRLCIKCSKNQATYNLVDEKARYCNQCKTDEMINVVNKCKGDTCTNSGSIKYNYYCTHCFQHLFPDNELSKNIRKKTKELYVRDYLKETIYGFIHDIPIWTGNCDCSHRRRIDFRKLIGNTLLCIEVDENQHKRYKENDEEMRYDDLFMLHGGKFIFIRFNPDKFINSNNTEKNPYMKLRMPLLKNEIDKQIKRILDEENEELLEIYYLFYDGYDYNL